MKKNINEINDLQVPYQSVGFLLVLLDSFSKGATICSMMRKKRSDRRHIVYVIVNNVTGERYVGITAGFSQKDLKVRIQKHVWRAFNEDKGWALCNSIVTYGTIAHTYGIYQVVRGKDAAHALERELIAIHDPALNHTGRKGF